MKHLLMAIMFLIRTPVYIDLKPEDDDFSRCTAFFPLVGIIPGGVVAGIIYLTEPLGREIAALLALTMYVYLTLGFHLDGMADCFDGLASGKKEEALMNVMKDSRIGTFAAASVSIALLFYFTLLRSADYRFLFFFPIAGRWTMTVVSSLYKPAKNEGLGYLFSKSAGIRELAIATSISCIIGFFLLGMRFVVPSVASIAASLMFAKNMSSRLGGINGDVLGASLVISEIVFLLTGDIMGVLW
ncbi:adenosylcobinamide-GDP ribazoletransferase [Calorimonas adulescens]|uniref:Adenosylcobinamide-GDP ribazoletransferase n=1 Tax=Calorimonas adulescens TaxID=2606906 RepID=A0A5D8Q9V1_9THEO|nr:adenosylcobinamide-GDP ribazoletransferase [Calorimonas adulescens]TZE80899.1 adenosylcobinamide-GDP ribazoletransferase [Calorimonas adulescens]